MSHIIPSRRVVLRTSAWALPAVVVATASPAFAVSSEGSLLFSAGTTGTAPFQTFYDLVFGGASVTAVGGSAPSQVTLTVTFTPSVTSNPRTGELHMIAPPASWSSPNVPGSKSTTLTFVSGAQVSEATPVPIPDGIFFGTNAHYEVGTFVLVFSAPGYESATAQFDTAGLLRAPAMSPSSDASGEGRSSR